MLKGLSGRLALACFVLIFPIFVWAQTNSSSNTSGNISEDVPFYIPPDLKTGRSRVELLRGISQQFPNLLVKASRNGSNIIEVFDQLEEVIAQDNIKRFIHPQLFSKDFESVVISLDKRMLEPAVEAYWQEVLNDRTGNPIERAAIADALFGLVALNDKTSRHNGALTGLIQASLGTLQGEAASAKRSELFAEFASFLTSNVSPEEWVKQRIAEADLTKFKGSWPENPQFEFTQAIQELRLLAKNSVKIFKAIVRAQSAQANSSVRELLEFAEHLKGTTQTQDFLKSLTGGTSMESDAQIEKTLREGLELLDQVVKRGFVKPLLKKEKGEVPFSGELVVIPPLYALVRGLLAGDCSTKSSALIPLSEYERVAVVRKDGLIKGYVSWTVVRSNNKQEAIYIHTAQGEIFADEIKTLLRMVKSYMIQYEGMPRDLVVTIPTSEQIGNLMHGEKIQEELSRLSSGGKTSYIDYWDNRFRDILESEHNHASYDSPTKNEKVRTLKLEETAVLTRSVESNQTIEPMTTEERNRIYAILESAESGSADKLMGYLRPERYIRENSEKIFQFTRGSLKFYDFWKMLSHLPDLASMLTDEVFKKYVNEQWKGILPRGANPSADPAQNPEYTGPRPKVPIRYTIVRGRRVRVTQPQPEYTEVKPVGRFIKNPDMVYNALAKGGKHDAKTLARFEKITAKFVGSGSCKWLFTAVTTY